MKAGTTILLMYSLLEFKHQYFLSAEIFIDNKLYKYFKAFRLFSSSL